MKFPTSRDKFIIWYLVKKLGGKVVIPKREWNISDDWELVESEPLHDFDTIHLKATGGPIDVEIVEITAAPLQLTSEAPTP